MEALEALGGEPMARDPDRRVSIAPQPTRSFSDSTLGAADELPPPVTGTTVPVHRADYQAVRAPGSSPARGAARPTHAPASPVWAPDARAAPAASYAMLGFGQPAAPEQTAPATGSGRAAAQEAARRIREQS